VRVIDLVALRVMVLTVLPTVSDTPQTHGLATGENHEEMKGEMTSTHTFLPPAQEPQDRAVGLLPFDEDRELLQIEAERTYSPTEDPRNAATLHEDHLFEEDQDPLAPDLAVLKMPKDFEISAPTLPGGHPRGSEGCPPIETGLTVPDHHLEDHQAQIETPQEEVARTDQDRRVLHADLTANRRTTTGGDDRPLRETQLQFPMIPPADPHLQSTLTALVSQVRVLARHHINHPPHTTMQTLRVIEKGRHQLSLYAIEI
jgi:hypothetical protein